MLVTAALTDPNAKCFFYLSQAQLGHPLCLGSGLVCWRLYNQKAVLSACVIQHRLYRASIERCEARSVDCGAFRCALCAGSSVEFSIVRAFCTAPTPSPTLHLHRRVYIGIRERESTRCTRRNASKQEREQIHLFVFSRLSFGEHSHIYDRLTMAGWYFENVSKSRCSLYRLKCVNLKAVRLSLFLIFALIRTVSVRS